VAHIRQSRPDSGLGFQVKVLDTLQGVPSSLGSGPERMGPAFRPRNVDRISVFEALLDKPALGLGGLNWVAGSV